MKWDSEISAMSILLFCNVASSSFLCLVSPFEFHVRMSKDFEVERLVDIFSFNES